MKAMLILCGVLFLLLVIFILLFVIFRNKAKSYKESYQEAQKRNEEYAAELGKAKAVEWIKSDERKKTDEKIKETNSKTGRDKFDAINDGLRNNGNKN